MIGFSRRMGIGVHNIVEQVTTSFTEFFNLTGEDGSYQPLGKLDCFYSKKKCVQLKNGIVQTGVRGGPIPSLTPLLVTVSTPY